MRSPIRIIHARAPARVCDNGGWTDTWFASYGRVFSIAIWPGADVHIAVYPRNGRKQPIIVRAENYGDQFEVCPGSGEFGAHPLIAATFDLLPIPDDVELEVQVHSALPPGASVGTSAAVSVALIAALDRLTPGLKTAHELAHAAHIVETQLLKQQSGIQDQLAAAYGGINYIEMTAYPHASVSPIPVNEPLKLELERRLSLLYFGKPHHSSAIHESVIRDLEGAGPDDARLNRLRQTAPLSRDALAANDIAALGRAMIENNEAQAGLKSELIGPPARAVIDIAKSYEALGWKVNGAGGDGGSITLLSGPDPRRQRDMIRAICAAIPECRELPIQLADSGAQAWDA